MDIKIIKSRNVAKSNEVFILHIGIGCYDLGIQIHKWGLRFMLIWWHVCIHF